MSQPPDNEKVTKNNERLFSIYENHLRSSNVKDYTETAAKLTVWLGNSKAYYTTARPMAFNRACQERNGVHHSITYIPLEQIAQMTLRGAVGYPLDISVPFMPAQWLDHPLTASYVMLVQATKPFGDLFVETPLKNAIAHLLQAVEGIPTVTASLPATSQEVSPSPLAPDSRTENHLKEISTRKQLERSRPASPQGSQTIRVHNLDTGTATAPPVSGQPSRHSSPEKALQNSPSASDLPNTARSQRNHSPEITFIETSHKPTTGSHGAASSAPLQGTQSSTSTARQGSRTKKPKKIDLSAFVQSDIRDFKQRQAQVQRGASDPIQIKKETALEETSLKATTNPINAERVESMTPLFSSSPAAQIQHSPNQNQSLQGHVQSVAQLHSELVCPSASHNLGHFEPSSQLTASHTLGQQRSNSAHVSPISNIQPVMGSSVPLGISASPTPLPLHTTDPQPTPTPSSVSTIADHPPDPIVVTPAAKQLTEGTPAPPTAPGVVDGIQQPVAEVEVQITPPRTQMRPLLISEDSSLARFLKLCEKFTIPKSHLNVESNTEPGGGESLPRAYLADDMAALLIAKETPKKRFQVITFTQGGTQDSFTEIAFNLTQSDMDYLSLWLNKRASQLKDTVSSYCLSLGCYSSQELMKRLEKQLHATIEAQLTEVIASMPSVWPQTGGLSMNVNFGGSRRHLPLAPPLVTTVDGYVDLSECALLGRNSITIHQEEKDVSDYTFVLHAHNPTLGQLQEIVRQRKSEVEWRDWLADVTRPLHIDVPPLSPTPS